jgi:hypothetical protein
MSICRGSRWFGLPNFFLVTARTGGATDRFEVVPLPTGADAGSFLRLPLCGVLQLRHRFRLKKIGKSLRKCAPSDNARAGWRLARRRP